MTLYEKAVEALRDSAIDDVETGWLSDRAGADVEWEDDGSDHIHILGEVRIDVGQIAGIVESLCRQERALERAAIYGRVGGMVGPNSGLDSWTRAWALEQIDPSRMTPTEADRQSDAETPSPVADHGDVPMRPADAATARAHGKTAKHG